MERTGVITFKGNPLTLLGPELHIGEDAPDFNVVNGSLEAVGLSNFSGKTIVISAVPSLDTPVCEIQTKRFNEEAASRDAAIITISLDLPFAQNRFCSANSIKAVTVLSDYQHREFAQSYGILIKELALLARAVFVLSADGKLVYQQIVPEVTDEPDYEAALAAIG